MSLEVERKCPDCGGAMKAIEIIDKTVFGIGSWKDPIQTALEYVVPGGKRSFWTGNLPIAGRVAACICEGCGRILLYGQPQATTAQSTGVVGMTESESRPPQLSRTGKLYSWIGGIGCGSLILVMATYPIWSILPESVGRALDFVVDALTTILLLWMLGFFLYFTLRKDLKANVVSYGFTLLVGLVACVMIWNLVAIHSQIGLQSIRPFGWELAARPGIIGLVFLVSLIILGAIALGMQKLRRQPKP
jgi:hypothetical protein